jgi:DNA-binding LacI/PurR family transcriptional regulator
LGTVTGTSPKLIGTVRPGPPRQDGQPPSWVEPWTPHRDAAATRLLLERSPDLTAIFVHSDMMAIGVLSALWQTGRRVPADVAVVSCDDIPFAEYLTPPLTTVRVPLAETARQAVELLLRSIAGRCTARFVRVPAQIPCEDGQGWPDAGR